MEPTKRRQILEKIATSDETSISDKLRALDLLERLESHPEADPDYLAWKEYMAMPDEKLDAELKALLIPLSTGPTYEGDAVFEAAVERKAAVLANEQTAALRRETHQLRKALKEAEARVQAPAPTGPGEAPRSAPSTSGAASENDRPLRVVPPEGIDLEAGWSKQSDSPVLTSFERKVRGLPEA